MFQWPVNKWRIQFGEFEWMASCMPRKEIGESTRNVRLYVVLIFTIARRTEWIDWDEQTNQKRSNSTII